MGPVQRKRSIAIGLAIGVVLASSPAAARSAAAQRLPIRAFDVDDGLAHSRVNDVMLDSRGFLWCATWEGLSRFDGSSFVAYGASEGLEIALLNVVVEDPRGGIWVGTQGNGIAELVPGPPPRFVVHPHDPASTASNVNAIEFDGRGRVWYGTEYGLCRAERGADGLLVSTVVRQDGRTEYPGQIARDASGAIWFASGAELLRSEGDDLVTVARFELLPDSRLVAMLAGEPDRWWVAQDKSLVEVDARTGAATPRALELDEPERIRALARNDRGELCIGTTTGLLLERDGRFKRATTANGLPDDVVRALAFDGRSTLWIGTWSGGIAALRATGVESFGVSSAFPFPNVTNLSIDREGRVLATTDRDGAFVVGERGVEAIADSRPADSRAWWRHVMQDSRGDWWIGTARSLHVVPGPKLDASRAREIGADQGVATASVFGALFEDRAGRVWFGNNQRELYRWDPAQSGEIRFEKVAARDVERLSNVRRIYEDRGGALWLASFSRLARLRGDALEFVEPSAGLPDVRVRCLFEDGRGRLWIGTRFHGVSWTDDPRSPNPAFRRISVRDGLSSDAVWSIAEDRLGRIYLGTGRGIDRFDHDTGRIEHFGSEAGLIGHVVNDLVRDRDGRIWAATSNGVSRIDPEVELAAAPPTRVRLVRVLVAGDEVGLDRFAVSELALPPIALERSDVSIEYAAVDASAIQRPLYQTRMGFAEPWSAPSAQTSTRLARLEPGAYRFEVRSADRAGLPLSQPASVSFRVLAPWWLRPQFVASAALAIAALGFAWHRARLRHAVALERIRAQIALDLHDDLGADLSQIAILTEVARRDAPAPAREKLAQVAELARSMRGSMSDIVWSIDPRHDRASDLVRRMRETALALTERDGSTFELRAPGVGELEAAELGPAQRRHVLLVFKEAMHNAVKHARATRIDVELALTARRLTLAIADDGVGFDPSAPSRGHGLRSMRERAQALGGTLELASSPGRGTRLSIAVPI